MFAVMQQKEFKCVAGEEILHIHLILYLLAVKILENTNTEVKLGACGGGTTD